MDDATVTEAPDVQEPTKPRSVWASATFLLSVALVLVLIGCAVWIATTRPAHPAAAGPHPAGPVRGCGPAGDPATAPPPTAPTTSWRLLGTMAAPSSSATGPAATSDGVPTCFSPDPAGALFAAATFMAATTDPALRRAAFAELAATTPGRHAALADLALNGPGDPTTGVQIAGYRFTAGATHGTATVDLALLSGGTFFHVPLHLTWTGGDWRIIVPVTGHPYDAAQALTDLADYVPWQGA